MAHTIKEETIDFIKTLPDDVSINEIMYHLYIKETVLQRITDIEDEKVKPISEQDAKDQIDQWLQ